VGTATRKNREIARAAMTDGVEASFLLRHWEPSACGTARPLPQRMAVEQWWRRRGMSLPEHNSTPLPSPLCLRGATHVPQVALSMDATVWCCASPCAHGAGTAHRNPPS
jgi:hypothetical protein